MPGLRDRPTAWLVAIAVAALPACSFQRVSVNPGDDDAKPGVDAAVDAVVIGDASSGWWDPAWTHRREITIQHTQLPGPVQSFPLLVRLPAGMTTGDLRVVATDQRTLLVHEVDTASPNPEVWVRIPDLPNSGPTPVLWLYYGNAAASDTSSGSAVFGDLCVSVHHLGQSLSDSSGHNHTASASGNERPGTTTGIVGEARSFDGSNDHLDLADETAYDFTTSLSVSAWIQRQDLGTVPYMAIVTKGDSSWRLHRQDMTQFVGFGTTANNNNDNLSGTTSIDDGNWHHVAIVFGKSKKRIFVDGRQDALASVGATIDTNNFLVSFGQNAESNVGGKRFWNGDIDEVRISATERDANWMFAEHHTVTDTAFVQVGSEESYPP
jgi:concanavalin A-like lectin/glucanase superfamily protein/uncharacterized protein DUF2341